MRIVSAISRSDLLYPRDRSFAITKMVKRRPRGILAKACAMGAASVCSSVGTGQALRTYPVLSPGIGLTLALAGGLGGQAKSRATSS